MRNRLFNTDDLKNIAKNKGFILEHHRYRRIFTLTSLSDGNQWGWVYFPHADQTVGKVNDLNLEGWKQAIEHSIAIINK
jgi:hypothetical protein